MKEIEEILEELDEVYSQYKREDFDKVECLMDEYMEKTTIYSRENPLIHGSL